MGAREAREDCEKQYRKWSSTPSSRKSPAFLISKCLTLASEISIYAGTAEIKCHYLMTLSILRYAA